MLLRNSLTQTFTAYRQIGLLTRKIDCALVRYARSICNSRHSFFVY